jgi:hypothetical protein
MRGFIIYILMTGSRFDLPGKIISLQKGGETRGLSAAGSTATKPAAATKATATKPASPGAAMAWG